MKLDQLTDNIRSKMSPADRKALGKAGMTGEEAAASFIAKNEGELQKKIIELLNLKAIPFQCSRMDKRTTGTVGWPDFTLAIAGRPIAFECKHEKHKLEPEQKKCIRSMIQQGWFVYLVRTQMQAHHIVVCHEHAFLWQRIPTVTKEELE